MHIAPGRDVFGNYSRASASTQPCRRALRDEFNTATERSDGFLAGCSSLSAARRLRRRVTGTVSAEAHYGDGTSTISGTSAGGRTILAMNKKRVVIAILWTYSCWVIGGMAEFVIGTPAVLGLAAGFAGALFFGLDPLGVVWPEPEQVASGAWSAQSSRRWSGQRWSGRRWSGHWRWCGARSKPQSTGRTLFGSSWACLSWMGIRVAGGTIDTSIYFGHR